MLFYSFEFLLFSVVLLAVLGLVHRSQPRKLVLLVASYLFYMFWNPVFILLILFTTTVNYLLADRIGATANPGLKKRLLAANLVANLGLLGWFKYAGFLEQNLLAGLALFGIEPSWTSLHITLPVGISFYTFQCLSYAIDVYRARLPVCKRPLDFALFVAFFPQLVAGPIVRAADFLPQLNQPVRLFFDRRTGFLILRGLFKKVLIADNLAVFSDAVFSAPGEWPTVIIWVATLCFSAQIYCDFSGYSDIAIGVARILGFRLPINFNEPYFARNPSDFWRRWHISLSTWLRDYLYIALGGNRAGRWTTYRNLMLTMLLGGLWHGASWNFVLWGLFHGLLLAGHRLFRERGTDSHATGTCPAEPCPEATSRGTDIRSVPHHPRSGLAARIRDLLALAATQFCVLLSWLIFRLVDTDAMLTALHKFLVPDLNVAVANLGLGTLNFFSTLLILGAFWLLHITAHVRRRTWDEQLGNLPLPLACLACFAIGCLFYLFWPLSETPFIYFQF